MGLSSQDILNMQAKHPSLKYIESNGKDIFAGELVLNHLYKEVRMTGKFDMEIIVPRDYPLALPTVTEVSKKLMKNTHISIPIISYAWHQT